MSIIPKSWPEKANRVWKVTTAPATEPLTAAQVRAFARIDGTDEDTLIDDIIKAVREATELYLGRALIEQTIKMRMDYWSTSGYINSVLTDVPAEDSFVELPQPPLISVTKIETFDNDDVGTTYDSANYFAETYAIPGRIVIKNGCTPPMNTDRFTAGVGIEYKAGYGSTAAYIPSAILNAMKIWSVAVWDKRAQTADPPPDARALLNLFRVIKL